MNPARPKKIWIDLDNSPHVPFFRPIIEELDSRGYHILLTARDSYQVCELLSFHGLSNKVKVVGRHYGKNRFMKIAGTCFRVAQLLPLILREKPDLAVSHGSRAQILSSFVTGTPLHIAFRLRIRQFHVEAAPRLGFRPRPHPGIDQHRCQEAGDEVSGPEGGRLYSPAQT